MRLELDPERRLALAYVPAGRRPLVETLWQLDAALGSVLATGREPMISRIRLAWWREALEKLDREPPPAEPMLQAVARHLLPAGLGGADLAAMEEGWMVLAEPGPLDAGSIEVHARCRGGRLFALSARLLGGEAEGIGAAGEAWALIDLARRVSRPLESVAAVEAARARARRGCWRSWPPRLRPLGMLAVLAERDAGRAPEWEKQGSPARMLRMIAYRLAGR